GLADGAAAHARIRAQPARGSGILEAGGAHRATGGKRRVVRDGAGTRCPGQGSRGMSAPEAVIVSTARTPLAKSFRGAFNMRHGAHLGGMAVRAAIERAGVEPGEIEDVLMGCAYPEGATGGNIARVAAYRAGCPATVAGTTVNRFCSSGLQTIALA